jgi:hypothetical protein
MHSQVYLYCNETKPSARLIQKGLPKEVQSLPANSECLSDFVLQSCYDGKLVPNLVHYVQLLTLSFGHLLILMLIEFNEVTADDTFCCKYFSNCELFLRSIFTCISVVALSSVTLHALP